jgi:hypothetical protein
MKKIFLATASLFFIMAANAQLRWGTTTNITKAVDRCRKPNGSALVRTDGAIKLYATFKDSKVSGYYAIDGNGKRIDPTNSSSKKDANMCVFCIYLDGGGQICYEVDCKNIPPPIHKK